MSDSKKNLDLTAIWARAGVSTATNVPRPVITKKNKKKKSASTSGGKLDKEKIINLANQSAEKEDTSVPTPPPSSSKAATEVSKKRPGEDLSAPDANLKRKKENIEEKLSESGRKLPSISDLQAYMRVGESGRTLFKELAQLMAGELTKSLEGKISELNTENRYLEGVLSRVTHDLYIYRDQKLISFSEDNRGLKEELAQLNRLKKVEEDLEAANKKVAEQKKQLRQFPAAEKELQESRQLAEEAEAREEALKARVEQLSKAADEHL